MQKVYVVSYEDSVIDSFDVQANTKIGDIKKLISSARNGISPDEMQLSYQLREIQDQYTLAEYHIGANKAILMRHIPNADAPFTIEVNALAGQPIKFQVKKSDKVVDLKNQIRGKLGHAVDDQKLVSEGRLLENQSTIGECGLQANSMLYLVLSNIVGN